MISPSLAAVHGVVVRKAATAVLCLRRVDDNVLVFYLVICLKKEAVCCLVNTAAVAFPQ